jgi:hypothetical protein
MTTSAPPPGEQASNQASNEETRATRTTGWTALRFRWWNLLLLVPLVTILPFLFNSEDPRLGGMPFFYWFQLAIIPVGVLCTVAVHLLTRHVEEEGDR